MLWTNFGKEIIRMDSEHLTIHRRFAVGVKDEMVKISDLRNLRIVPIPKYDCFANMPFHRIARAIYAPELGRRVAFDVHCRTIYMGNFLNYTESKAVLHEIEKRTDKAYEFTNVDLLSCNKMKIATNSNATVVKYSQQRDSMITIAIC